MAGEYFDPVVPKPKHRCDLPLFQGSGGFRCECGKAYVVENLGEHDRGVDPNEPMRQWRRAPEYDVVNEPTQ